MAKEKRMDNIIDTKNLPTEETETLYPQRGDFFGTSRLEMRAKGQGRLVDNDAVGPK